MIIISESGLYTLIIRSNKPQAKPFRKWVTAEVLPSIRRTGGYVVEAPAGGNRTDIFHHRGPRSASGLDIRYTLDLTKILTNPQRPALDLLERLTGVRVTDLVQEPEPVREVRDGEEALELFASWFFAAVEDCAGGSVLFADLYRGFLGWCGERRVLVSGVAGLRALLIAWLGLNGYTLRAPFGWETVDGCRLVLEVAR